MADSQPPRRRSTRSTSAAAKRSTPKAKPAKPVEPVEVAPAAEPAKPVETDEPVDTDEPGRGVEQAASPPAAAAAPTAAPEPDTPQGPRSPARRRRVLLTGGAGFVGGAVARVLAERGDDVVALVRDARRAQALTDLGATVLEDDLSDVDRLTDVLRETAPDAAIHAAGSYRVGIRREERGAMWDANVGTTTRILDAAERAGTPRIVYVSTVNAFGNTHGRVVDETYRRNLAEGFVSWYDETKYGAHEVVEQRTRGGAPIVIAMPSQVYGPRDHSAVGEQLSRAAAGKLGYRALDEVGLGLVHVDDLAVGIVAVLDRGEIGRQYVLSGPTTTLADAITLAASIAGRKAPGLRVPTSLLSAFAPIGGAIGQPNLREVISASSGVTYWATADRAAEELGWTPRDLQTGFRDVFGSNAAGSGTFGAG
jgi:dihydroflavonol-4-reductase